MKEEDHKHIAQYLEGKLSDSAKQAFERRLANEPELANILEMYRGTDLLIEEAYKEELRTEIGDILSDLGAPEEGEDEEGESLGVTKEKVMNPWYWGIAASVLLLVGVGLWWVNQAPLHERVFEEYFEPYMVGGPTRSGLKTGDDSIFLKGWEYYELGDFKNAEKEFSEIRENSPIFKKVQFYKAISLLALRKHQEAERLFQAISSDESMPYQTRAQWYLALSYIGRGEVELGREVLEGIGENGDDSIGKRAKVVLDFI